MRSRLPSTQYIVLQFSIATNFHEFFEKHHEELQVTLAALKHLFLSMFRMEESRSSEKEFIIETDPPLTISDTSRLEDSLFDSRQRILHIPFI